MDQKGLALFKAVSFFVGGTIVLVDIPPAITALTGAAAYAALASAVQTRLTALNITDVVVSTLTPRETVFSDDVVASPEQPNSFGRGQSAGFYTPILVTSKSGTLARGQADTAATAQNTNILNTQLFSSDSQNQLININVDLEKVGLAGDGGNLIIGSMNKTSANVFNATETNTPTKSGIEQFNLSVKGTAEKSTSLASLQSTNNNLKAVFATTDAAVAGPSYAGLEIGNTRTGAEVSGIRQAGAVGLKEADLPSANNQNALKDVQTFNASGLKGDLTLFAGITNESVAKYMTLTDGAPISLPVAAAADNVAFVYTGGSGKNYINLNISPSNLAAAGTTTREDFVLTINGGAGDDRISTQIGDGTLGATNWYANSKINANLNINAGDGNDTIRTFGSGDFKIDAGPGNDTVYADNTGAKAVYVFNAQDGDAVNAGVQLNTTNLLSQAAATVSAVNASLTVTFKGFNAAPVNIAGSTAGSTNVSSNGALTNVTISDLNINQAIKASINSDPVLSKLLIAQDGPGRTLVVTSLIDGTDVGAADLGIAFGSAPLTAAQTAAVTPTNTLTVFSAAAAGNLNLLDGYGGFSGGANTPAPFATNDALANVTGLDSTNEADNTITPGTGDDVIVLGTGANSNDTIVYSGFANGRDSIVNFTAAAGTSQDFLSFTGYNLTGTGGINGGIVIGALDTTKTGTYINFVENATNPGEYLVTLVDLGATSALTDNIAPVTIATIDFGATQAFTSSNFNFNPVSGPVGATPVAPVIPGPGGSTAVTPAAGAAVVGAAGGNFTYNIANPTVSGPLTYSIPGFGAGDKIVSPTGVAPSLLNSSFSDGTVTLQYTTPGNVVNITLTGLTNAQDGSIFGASDLNNVFGAGTFV